MRKWWKRRPQSKLGKTDDKIRSRAPLREFVYLDDASLRSLLSSQKGELTDQVTELLSQADEAELASTIGASSPVLKAEVRSRYQVTTSQGRQTSRKAIVQSLFKELLELEWIDVALRPQGDPSGARSLHDLVASDRSVPAHALRRGTLVEVEVELAADPIFRFSTIASELTELARDFPEMLDEAGAREGLATLIPGNRFLQRFLAGLVPLRATATSHVVVEHEGIEHVILANESKALGLASRPLTVVGVTEQVSYWRDVRRVLFSGSRFTMLCRITRDGLWDAWQPVKLAEVLKEVAPTFPDLMADVGRIGLNAHSMTSATGPSQCLAALGSFIDSVGTLDATSFTAEGLASARQAAATAAAELPATVTGQNEAFRIAIAALQNHGCTLGTDTLLDLQRQARETAGLALFDQSQRPAVIVAEGTGNVTKPDDRLLDTEVIAIYW